MITFGYANAAHKAGTIPVKKMVTYIILIIILVVSFAIRYKGIPFGLPIETHPDEPRIVNTSLRIIRTGDLNPHFFNYPSVYIYMQAALFKISGLISPGTDINDKNLKPLLYSRGRLMTVCISMGTILLVFFLSRMLFGSVSALAATSFLAFSYNHIANSFLITVDSPMTFFVLLSVFMSVLILLMPQKSVQKKQEFETLSSKNEGPGAVQGGLGHRPIQVKGPAWKFYILNSIFIGIAVGCKYTAILAIFPFLFAHLAVNSFSIKKIFNWKGIIAIPLLIAAFLITTPYSILDHHTFLKNSFYDVKSYANGFTGSDMESKLSYGPYFAYLIDGFGLIPLLFAFGGGLILLFYHKKYHEKIGFLLLIYPIFFFLFIGAFRLCFMRNLMTILPFLSIFAGVFMASIWNMAVFPGANMKRVTQTLRLLAAAFIILPGIYGVIQQGEKAVKYVQTITLPDTRLMCKNWIDNNLPSGARIILDFYTMEPDKTKFKIKKLGIGALGNYRKYTSFDYIITSNFDYDRFFKNEKQYPNQIENYRKIFTYPMIREFKCNGINNYGPILRVFQLK